MDEIDFRCNICGNENQSVPRARFGREDGSCRHCGSSVRMRSIIHHLSMGLFQRPIVLREFPERHDLHGIGLSDWDGYADVLAQRLAYVNTFFHKQPLLDIAASIPQRWLGRQAFVLSSDVLEHVPPPVDRAFHNSLQLLQPGGLLVLTVPFGAAERTTEHFPELHEYAVTELAGSRVLVNRTAGGTLQVFGDLVFHGGDGATLEMRDFARGDVVRLLERAGFVEIRVHEAEYLPFGIVHQHRFGLTITAWRPL